MEMQTDKRGETAVTTFMLLLIVACAFILSGFLFDYVQKQNAIKKFQSEHILFNGEWCNELRLCTPYREDVDCFFVKKFDELYKTCDIDNDTSTCSNSKYTYKVSCL
jgi:hypothetical protein